MELRPDNVPPVKFAWTFLEPIKKKMPQTMASSRIRTRLDSFFYSKDIVVPLDERNIGYAIVAKMHKSLKEKIVSSRFIQFAEGWEATDYFSRSEFQKRASVCCCKPSQGTGARRSSRLEYLNTLQRTLMLSAEWIKRGDCNILWLPKQYPQQDLFLKVQRAVSKVKPLI